MTDPDLVQSIQLSLPTSESVIEIPINISRLIGSSIVDDTYVNKFCVSPYVDNRVIELDNTVGGSITVIDHYD